MQKLKLPLFFIIIFCVLSTPVTAQSDESLPPVDIERLQKKIGSLRTTELVMSMSQRSLIMPGYLTELKALIAKQAYNFWSTSNGEPYVSHLNVYSSLHQANKFLDYDSIRGLAYNQVGAHTKKVTAVQFGGDPNTYYSSSADGTVLKWNLKNSRDLPEVIYQSEHIIKSLDVSDDGRWLMAVFYQTGMALVALEQKIGKDILAIEDPEAVQTAVFMPNEQKYLSVSRDGKLKVKGFQTATKQIGTTEATVISLEVSEDDGTIYAGTLEGVLEGWEQQSYFGYELGTPAILCLDISPDGKLLAIGRERGDAILWNIEQKKLERLISGHQSAITDIEFSPDNQQLLTTSRDRTARLWDLSDSRKLPIIMDDHDDWVLTGCFDPSGRQIITGSQDEYVRTWPVDPQALADRICSLLSRNMTKDEWNEFVGTDIPYEKTCSQFD
jgi:WD40 repeat protein